MCVTEHRAREQQEMANRRRKQHLLMEASQIITQHPYPARKRQDKAGVLCVQIEGFSSRRLWRGRRKEAGWDARAELALPQPVQEGQLWTIPNGQMELSQAVVGSQEGF